MWLCPFITSHRTHCYGCQQLAWFALRVASRAYWVLPVHSLVLGPGGFERASFGDNTFELGRRPVQKYTGEREAGSRDRWGERDLPFAFAQEA